MPALQHWCPDQIYYRYSIGGREFSIDDESLHDLLLNNRKHIDTIVLEAHEWHPTLTDEEGNIVYEDDAETMPARNVEVTNKTFFFILAIRTDEVEHYVGITRNKTLMDKLHNRATLKKLAY